LRKRGARNPRPSGRSRPTVTALAGRSLVERQEHPARFRPSRPSDRRGLTREAYTLDLRQFTSWCQVRLVPLFSVRRADIETFARELEARGRARTTVTRRLCTIAGFYKYAVEEELLEHSPAAHVRRPRLDYESHATALDRNELGAILLAAGLGPPASTPSSPCSRSTGCECPRPSARTSSTWASSAATGPWSSPARRQGRHHPARPTHRPRHRPGDR
jgi:integrase